MIKEFQALTSDERALLIKAPAIISLLASIGSGQINEWEKSDAIKLAHVKTFTAARSLVPYYKEVEKQFKSDFEILAEQYKPFEAPQLLLLQNEVVRINVVIKKLDSVFSAALQSSLLKYSDHVKKGL